MNGIAPLATWAIGWLAWALVVRNHHLDGPLRTALTWAAIFGVPYIGIELVTTGAKVVTNGSGSDFAAVSGLLGLPYGLRALAMAAGLGWYVASAWVVLQALRAGARPAVAGYAESERHSAASLSQGAAQPARPRWRLLLGGLLVCAVACGGLVGGGLAASGQSSGPTFMFLSLAVWGLATAVLVPWRHPAAHATWRQWVRPGLLASAVLFVYGLVAGNDYANIGFTTLPPVIAAALVATGLRSARPADAV